MRASSLVWVLAACGCGRTTLAEDAADSTPEELVYADGEPGVDATPEVPAPTEADADATRDAPDGDATWDDAPDGDANASDDAADADGEAVEDAGPGPVVLTTKLVAPRAIAIGAGFAWVTDMAGQIARVPLTGGDPVKVATAVRPTYIAVESTYVYWTDLGVGTPNSGSVGRYDMATGAATLLAKAQDAPNSTVLRGPDVLWAHGGGSGEIRSVPRAGGVVATVASAEPFPYYVTANSTRICWVRRTLASSIVCRQDGAAAVITLAPASDYIRHLAIDESHAYWITEDGHLRGMALSGGAPSLLWPEPPTTKTPAGAAIALDATHVYWLVGRYVRKVAKTGGPVTELATDKYPLGIAVDATHVYWTSENTVKRVAR
ncbi:MAG: hypothetical protein HYV09_32295 [Deltaproteobacteria bacterium]|nr:hypothetical protein [Deltaproteobacteria bacterium]